MKIFISQETKNLSEEQILKRRSEIVEFLETQFSEFEVLDNVLDLDKNELQNLGESIGLLSEADLVVFDTGWYNSRDCLIEFKCCNLYGIKMLFI